MGEVDAIAGKFAVNSAAAWDDFHGLDSWVQREEVLNTLSNMKSKQGLDIFMDKYRTKMKPFIQEDFYDSILYSEKTMKKLAKQYEEIGEVEVDFLKKDALGMSLK